ncbi:MAG: bifunctional UDP-N-acetylmuramoyl-tripeptide:D-alanyl-D-alanine ligase/alanine racemase [Bacteroidales bacterium]|nr:bifunctional UDP-N-acetylmuramoyl-tripeptide:D-alanyl-D-alanine ligase/alanine racemase [Bacteroidales bacterium]
MIYRLQHIADVLQAVLKGNKNVEINQIIIDSRNVTYGPGTLFFALCGERNDGHRFIESLIANGIRNFVISDLTIPDRFPEANYILVNDTFRALQQFVSYHRSQYKIPVIGITGSNGKTIVKEWLAQCIANDKRVVKNPMSYNSQVGVPLSVWQLESDTEIGVFECGISLPGEMERLERIVKPSIGVITNIGEAHQENFQDHKQKAQEKLKLFIHTDTIIYCKDHTIIHDQINTIHHFREKKLFTWSMNKGADLSVLHLNHLGDNTEIEADYKGKKIRVSIPFIDAVSIENALHVWSVLLYLGYDNEIIRGRMQKLTAVAMRMELKKGIRGCTLINDSYNSDVLSLRNAIDFLLRQKQNAKRTIILSDIQQSGKSREDLYREVAAIVNKQDVDRLICIGPELFASKGLFNKQSDFYLSTDDFLSACNSIHFEDEAILLKGARSYQFERISEKLEEVVHQTVLEINFNALVYNLNYFKSFLKPETKVMVMVKALAYGSGTYEIAQLLNHHRVDYLGVAFADEGVALRNAGIGMPIMVMGPDKNALEKIIEYYLEPEIYSLEMAKAFSQKLKVQNRKKYPVHIKIDSGMHRLGFMKEDVEKLVMFLKNNDYLYVRSVFSHLAGSDAAEFDDFTLEQISVYQSRCKRIEEGLNYSFLKHILNSSGIERFPDYQMDMVRLGIGLYGVSAISNNHLKHISSLKSTIIQVKPLSKTETVGYSRRGKLNRDSTIAIVPVGYADGLNRRLGNGNWQVVINGQKAPTIGNICMDLMMVDITDLNAKEGDEVIIFGELNTISDIAEKLDTIPYEILTGISTRVKRLYFHE